MRHFREPQKSGFGNYYTRNMTSQGRKSEKSKKWAAVGNALPKVFAGL
jgi:hypothetical protein